MNTTSKEAFEAAWREWKKIATSTVHEDAALFFFNAARSQPAQADVEGMTCCDKGRIGDGHSCYMESLDKQRTTLQPATQSPEVPFDKERLAHKAFTMFKMIDTEQMMRTVKALRELNMTPHLKALSHTQHEGGMSEDDDVEVVYIELGHGEYGISVGLMNNDPTLVISRLDSPEEVGAKLPKIEELSGGETIISFKDGRGIDVFENAVNSLRALLSHKGV